MIYDSDGSLSRAAKEVRSRSVMTVKEEVKAEVKAEVKVESEGQDPPSLEEVKYEPERWWEKAARRREALAEEARAEAGVTDVEIGASLRTTWMCAQRADPSLTRLLKGGSQVEAEGYRTGADGLLEKLVRRPNMPEFWVPVVPDGAATAHMSWKKWSFLQVHVGVFGGHRSAAKTLELLGRICFWKGMEHAVTTWVDQCITCVKFRKRPVKQEAVAVRGTTLETWEEVMVDMEGPSSPPDTDGNIYTLTYMCLLCHAVLLEPMKRLVFSEVRRAFSKCMFRSGTLPLLLRSDRGPEFRNQMLREYTSLVGIRQRFGTAWRPVEQGAVERMHQEEQKLLGILVHDVMKSYPNEWTELLPVIEFLIYNTPGPHGLTPRDIDRRWSLALPLEKELMPFQALSFEPISEHAKNLFKTYRELRAVVIKHYADASEQRAKLANRFRRSRTLEPGMKVVYRDPRATGGRTPYKQGLSGPCEVLRAHGNHVVLRKADGSEVEVHVENVVIVPHGAQDLESRAPLEWEADEEKRRSPGQMIEAKEEAAQAMSAAKLALTHGDGRRFRGWAIRNTHSWWSEKTP